MIRELQKSSSPQNKSRRFVPDELPEDVADDNGFKVLSGQEVLALTEKWGGKAGKNSLSEFLFRVLWWQVLMLMAISVTTWLVSSSTSAAFSAFYGALCAVLPSALVARTMFRHSKTDLPVFAGDMMMKLLVLELAKVALTIGMLAAALLVLNPPDWIAIVIAFVVTLKVYWLVALVGLKRPRHVKKSG